MVACWVWTGIDVSMSPHVYPFEYVRESVFVADRASDFVQSEVFSVASEVSSAEGAVTACCVVQRFRNNTYEVSHFSS